MLKSKVGYSINPDNFITGMEAAKQATKDFTNVKLSFVYTSENNDIKQVINGIRDVTESPIIGCTSSGGLITPDGYIFSETGYAGMLTLNDANMTIGVAVHEAGKDPRAIGRKVAIEAVQNASSTRAPAYFYMVASPKNEEAYLMGIQDVIGRVPMFGGSAATDSMTEDYKIICNDKIINDGVAVAFIYSDNEIVTKFNGMYNETNNIGLITKVENERELVSIDGVSALKRYSQWTNNNPQDLIGNNLLLKSVLSPLGTKDPLGNMTVIRHPQFGNDMGTKKVSDDTILLGNTVVEKTAIINLSATEDQLVNAPHEMLKELKRSMYTEPAAYILIHDGARRMVVQNRVKEIADQITKEAHGVPFIMPFTFGEYGYDDHTSNICGGLMLSFTAIGKN